MDHETMGNSLQQVASALEFGAGNSRLTLSEASASKQTTLLSEEPSCRSDTYPRRPSP
jgi:hypothetical protein